MVPWNITINELEPKVESSRVESSRVVLSWVFGAKGNVQTDVVRCCGCRHWGTQTDVWNSFSNYPNSRSVVCHNQRTRITFIRMFWKKNLKYNHFGRISFWFCVIIQQKILPLLHSKLRWFHCNSGSCVIFFLLLLLRHRLVPLLNIKPKFTLSRRT